MSNLALLGGAKAVTVDKGEMFDWPIVNSEMEESVLSVLRAGNMSGTDITEQFENEFADWHGVKYGLAANTGTAALHAAMYGAGVGRGDEIICPSLTYWASCLQVYSLGGSVVFADVDPDTFCIDPNDIEHRITDRTRAIMVVHYCGQPADMDRIMPIARKYGLKVIEDVSHAHGALYKGKMVGTFGDVAGISVMTGKAFAVGEGGIMITNDENIYQRAIALGWYERHDRLTAPDLVLGAGLPWGGQKYRMHQISSAVGRVQVKKYPEEMAEIDKAMNYFWDLLDGVPGISSPRPPKDSGSTMGGWYSSLGKYNSDELGGLSVTRFCEAVAAEGVLELFPGCNKPLHLHPVFQSIDVYRDGKPSRNAFSNRDLAQLAGSLPVSESIHSKVFRAPWFKHFKPQFIEQYADAIKKVVSNYADLLPGDTVNPLDGGSWSLSHRKK